MKPGSVYRVRISTKDYRSLLDTLDVAGIDTEENSDILAGLTLSILLEVFRKANTPKDGAKHSEIMQSFIVEAQHLREVWNVSGATQKVSQDESILPPNHLPLESWSMEQLRREYVRLGQYPDNYALIARRKAIEEEILKREPG